MAIRSAPAASRRIAAAPGVARTSIPWGLGSPLKIPDCVLWLDAQDPYTQPAASPDTISGLKAWYKGETSDFQTGYAWDDFTRADAATLGNASLLPYNTAWTADSGTWGIASNKANMQSATIDGRASLNAGVNDNFIVHCDITTSSATDRTNLGVTLLGDASGQLILARVKKTSGVNEVRLFKRDTGGSYTSLASLSSAGLADNTTYACRVIKFGNRIDFVVLGVGRVSHTLAGGDITTYVGTRVGLQSIRGAADDDGASRFDNFKVLEYNLKNHDGFDRANAASLGNGDLGNAWTAHAGTWGVASNRANLQSSTLLAHATIDTGVADGVAECAIQLSATLNRINMGLALRDSGTDHLQVQFFKDATNNAIRIRKIVGGTPTTLAELTSAGLSESGQGTVKVYMRGAVISVFLDGVHKVSHTLSGADQTTFGSNTKHGLACSVGTIDNDDGGSRWNDYRFYTKMEDGDAVDQWLDASGNSYTASQATATSRPLYKLGLLGGKPGLRFDGSNDNLALPSSAHGTFRNKTGGWIVVVAKSTNTGATQRLLYAANNAGGVRLALNKNSTNQFTAQARRLDADGLTTATPLTDDAAFHIWSSWCDWSAGSLALDVDAVRDGTGSPSSGSTSDTDSSFITISGTSDPLNGDICEVLMYDRAPSASEREQVYRWLAEKYGTGLGVKTWSDKSAGAKAFTQATLARRPLHKLSQQNGRAAIVMDGSDDGLEAGTDTYFDFGGNWTWFFVVKVQAGVGEDFGRLVSKYSGGVGGYMMGVRTANGRAQFLQVYSTTTGVSEPTTAINDAAARILAGVSDASDAGKRPKNYYNGALDTTGLQTQGVGTVADSAASIIGIGGITANTNLSASFMEVVCYNRPLTDAERKRVERYLARKWGVTLAA